MKGKSFFCTAFIALFLISGIFAQNQILTASEQNFVNNLPEISVLLSDNDFPFSVFKDNVASGAIPDYMNLISEKTGLKFKFVSNSSKDEKTVLIAGVHYSNKTKTNPSTTSIPFLYSNKYFIQTESDRSHQFAKPGRFSISSMNSDDRQLIKELYSDNDDIIIIETDSSISQIRSLKKNEVDQALLNEYVLYALWQKPQYENLKIATLNSFSDNYYFQLGEEAASIDGARLISILNKAISSLGDETMVSLVENTIVNAPKPSVIEHMEKYKWEFLLLILIFCLVLFGVVLFSGQHQNFATLFINKSKQLETLSTTLNTGIIEVNPSSLKIEFVNAAFLALLQHSENEIENFIGETFTDYIQEKNLLLSEIGKLLIKDNNDDIQKSFSIQIRLSRRDRSTLPVILNATLTSNSQGKPTLYMILFDNSSQVYMLEKYQNSKEKYELIMDKTNEIQYEIDLLTGSITTSDKLFKKMGWTFPHKISSINFADMWHINKQNESEFTTAFTNAISTGESQSVKTKMKKASGIEIWVNILFNPITKNGKTIKIFGTVEDIDYETREKELIMFKASTDPLTGLYQKDTFFDLCRKYLKKSILEPDTNGALIFMDLDNFKQVNDILGHLEGDTAICDTARKLQVIFSQYDIVSRFGGDEFCILVKNIPLETLSDKLNWILEKMRETYTIGDNSVTVTASIGVALFPKDGTNLDKLLECADKALYTAKKNGKNQYAFYE